MSYRVLFFILFLLSFRAGYPSNLHQTRIQLDAQILDVEIADSESSRARGLMGRKVLAEGFGMLFVYEKPQNLSFWMKNTLIPLSIAFFDETQKLINLADMPVSVKRQVSSLCFRSASRLVC